MTAIRSVRSRSYMDARRRLIATADKLLSGGGEAIGQSCSAVYVIRRQGPAFAALEVYELGLAAAAAFYGQHGSARPFDPEAGHHTIRRLVRLGRYRQSDEVVMPSHGRLGRYELPTEADLTVLADELDHLHFDRRL